MVAILWQGELHFLKALQAYLIKTKGSGLRDLNPQPKPSLAIITVNFGTVRTVRTKNHRRRLGRRAGEGHRGLHEEEAEGEVDSKFTG